MLTRCNEVRTYFVCFRRVMGNRRWFHWFIKPQFGHVYLLTKADDNGCILYEPLEWGVNLTYWDVSIDDAVMAQCHAPEVTAVLAYTVDYGKMPDYYVRRGIFTCVSAVKAVLGLKTCGFLVTPMQLYKHLLKSYAIPAKAYIPYVNEIRNNIHGRNTWKTET